MTQRLSDLDRAIDAVAQRLTAVEASPEFAARIAASLPERSSSGWLLTSWVPRLAVLALAAVTSMLVIDRGPGSLPSDVLHSAPVVAATALRASVEPETLALGTLGNQPLELLEPLEPLEPRPDHAFSLAALDVEALPPMNLPAAASIDLAPLAIDDLPLSGEFRERD